jgi:hypothetical protein
MVFGWARVKQYDPGGRLHRCEVAMEFVKVDKDQTAWRFPPQVVHDLAEQEMLYGTAYLELVWEKADFSVPPEADTLSTMLSNPEEETPKG